MRLHWFGPLPPEHTGIADYASEVLPALTRQAEVVLWSEREARAEPVDGVQHRRYRADLGGFPWAELNRGDLCVYQVGNNPRFHSSVWRVSQQHPGLVVLHDWSLHDLFFMHFHEVVHHPHAYEVALRQQYGEAAAGRVEQWRTRGLDEEARRRFPLTGLALAGASGVLVHTQQALDQARWLTSAPVFYSPLAYASRHPQRARRPLEGRQVELVIFGYLGGNRRLESVLTALASLEARARFRLNILGSVADEPRVRQRIQQLGLKSQVRLHGYVTEEVLEAALREADLAINLRFPTMGEASGSQLRIWSHGLPSLVTRTGWYADLPEDAVAFVEPQTELVDLQRHLTAFVRDPEPYLRQGRAGHARLRAHDPERYAKTLLEAAEAARAYRLETARERLEQSVARALPGFETAAFSARLFSPRPARGGRISAGRLDAAQAQLDAAASGYLRTLEEEAGALQEALAQD